MCNPDWTSCHFADFLTNVNNAISSFKVCVEILMVTCLMTRDAHRVALEISLTVGGKSGFISQQLEIHPTSLGSFTVTEAVGGGGEVGQINLPFSLLPRNFSVLFTLNGDKDQKKNFGFSLFFFFCFFFKNSASSSSSSCSEMLNWPQTDMNNQ